MKNRHRGAGLRWTCWLALAAGLAGCGGSKTSYDALFVAVTAESGVVVDQVRFYVLQVANGTREVTPRDPDRFADFTFATAGRDLAKDPLLVKVKPGSHFAGAATLMVLGQRGTQVAARAVAPVDLNEHRRVTVTLRPLPAGCDEDGDGFSNCDKAGCCAAGEALRDCNDAEARATPVGYEDECTRCGFGANWMGDAVDDDCDGTPAQCRDQDNDQAIECLPAWCEPGGESEGSEACNAKAASLDCDPNSAVTRPGAPEICDGKDNDCDRATDEDIAFKDWDGSLRKLGESCGTGACAGGTVECDPDTHAARCSTASKASEAEICRNELDDNCNGFTDDPVEDGCVEQDTDGDGVPDDLEDKYCGPLAKIHSEVFPDYDAMTHPDVPPEAVHSKPEPCCCGWDGTGACPELCDRNCDGECKPCAAADEDCDGFSKPVDCDDSDPHVYPGAPEKCGDGVDQDCKGGDLPCTGTDADKDGFLAGLGDCDDQDPLVHPFADEVCNGRDDNCDGVVDEGNAGGADEPCGQDIGECEFGWRTCDHPEGQAASVVCKFDRGPVEEVCDGKDNDCDADTDNGFAYDPATGGTCRTGARGAACGGLPRVGEACDGIGECGKGVVECVALDRVTCSTNPDGSERQDKAETCNNLDDDCDGQTDEDLTDVQQSTCSNLGVCGGEGHSKIHAVCQAGKWACDYSDVPGYEAGAEKSCDEKDNDCDGDADEDFDYSDAVHPEKVKKGAGCGTGACANGKVVCRPDGTGLMCDTSQQQANEICDGLDNDCNGQTDEGFTFTDWDGSKKQKEQPCGTGACAGGTVVCAADFSGFVCSTAGKQSAEVCDGIDNDCDGLADDGFPFTDWDGSKKQKGQPCGTGACAGGTVVCAADQTGLVCSTAALAKPETCDNQDDDCDGSVDENLTSVQDSTCKKVGVCLTGIDKIAAVCVSGAWQCSYAQVPNYEPGAEKSCDGLDNDCNGQTDEDFQFLDWNGTIKMKGEVCGTGACAGGTVVCASDKKGVVCSTAGQSSPETCNNQDDDCDGSTDENLTSVQDSTCRKVGVCLTGIDKIAAVCSAGKWFCDYSQVPGYEAGAEKTCDALDNDCDGQTDEDFEFTDWNGTKKQKGEVCGTGICANGVVQCSSDKAGVVCSTAGLSGPETCNGKDDNCNGQTDEGTDILCTDGKTCTNDVCEGGKCKNNLIAGNCLIAQTCYADNATNPSNQCQECRSSQNPTGWSSKTDDTPCDYDANGCTLADHCESGVCKAGPAADCSYLNKECVTGWCQSTSATSFECKKTIHDGQSCDDSNPCTKQDSCNGEICAGVLYSCDDGAPCTVDICLGDGGCSYGIAPDFCEIPKDSKTCVAINTTKPDNACLACLPDQNPYDWSALPSTTGCDDGNACTIGDHCDNGSCAGTALVCPEPNPTCSAGDCYCDLGPPAVQCDPAVSDTCDEGTCKCGATTACNPTSKNPTCSGGVCKCGSTVCGDSADKCDNGTCKCGNTGGSCVQPNPVCSNQTCYCNPKISLQCSTATADACTAGACKCGATAACDPASKNPTCSGGQCKCGSTICDARSDRCTNNQCKCGTASPCGTGKVCCNGTCCGSGQVCCPDLTCKSSC